MACIVLVNLFTYLLLLNCVHCEWFSSLGQMKDLVNADKDLLETLRRFIDLETEKIEFAKK